MAATTAAMLKKPLAVILLVILFMPGALIVPIALGAYIGAALVSPRKKSKN